MIGQSTMAKASKPKKDLEGGIDTGSLGLALAIHAPQSLHNSHRDKYKVEFDTGIEMLVPKGLFLDMVLHLQEV